MDGLDRKLSALADPTRRRIIEHIAGGPATVSELVKLFEYSQPTISSHVKLLEQSGLISRTRVAQTRPCQLEPDGLQGIGLWLGELRTIYTQNYERLDAVLDQLKSDKEHPQ